MWLERLENCGLWVENWLTHQRRDDYWRRASVCENYTDVQVPVLASSGWADGYSNAVTRLLEHLDVPRKGLTGPWSHKYPHLGEPGPAIGYLQEVVRWWDHWLKFVENGVDGRADAAHADAGERSALDVLRGSPWPLGGRAGLALASVHPSEHLLARHRVARAGEAVAGERVSVESPLSVGQFAGKWASYNAPLDLPYDQREEDGGSMVLDTDELTERCEVLGTPVVKLVVSANKPVAMVAARLSDVAPDGRATRVIYGLLNLTHRDGHDYPEPLVPGRKHEVTVQLNSVAQLSRPGTGSGSRSRRPIGRSPGLRPNPSV
jgi:putative CocE/NonD family hydrolase